MATTTPSNTTVDFASDKLTFQSNIHTHNNKEILDYSLFLGGLNVTKDSLMQYDPLKTGFGRLFMVHTPQFVKGSIPSKLAKFKHILEYANTGVNGLTNMQMSYNPIQGGYTNRTVEIPNLLQDDMQSFTVKTFEFSGSPVREVIQYWLTGVSDPQSGFATYHGSGDKVCQANHTAEFIYLVTDQTGYNVEYACMFANCMPKEIKLDQFSYDSGQHELVSMDIEFTCTRYMSPQINNVAEKLLAKYNVLMDSLNFNSGLNDDFLNGNDTNGWEGNYVSNGNYVNKGTYYDGETGKLAAKTTQTMTNEFVSSVYEEGKTTTGTTLTSKDSNADYPTV